MVSLLLVLNQGQGWGWGSVRTLALALVAAGTLGVFVWLEGRRANPMLDLSLFRKRTFSFSVISALLNYMSTYSIIFLLPFYFIQGRGFQPAQAGLILTAQPLVMALVAPLSGSLSDRFSPRWLATGGMAIMTLGLWMLSQAGAQTSVQTIVIALLVTGLGTGVFISPNTNVLLGSAPRNRQGIASGILATARNVGMVLGVGLAGAIFLTVQGHGELTSDPTLLFQAIRTSFLVSFSLAALGIVTSYLRSSGAEEDLG